MTTDSLAVVSLNKASSPRLNGLPLYLLIDPFFGEPAALDIDLESVDTFDALASIRQAAWMGRAVELPTAPDPVIEPLSLPYLVTLKDSNDPVLTMALQMARDEREEALASGRGITRIGALLETRLPADRVMDRLQRMWSVSFGGVNRYLRMSDARVFELLTHLFEAHELRLWLGPIDHWHYLARDGCWQAFDGAVADTLIESEEALYCRSSRLEQLADSEPRLPWTSERRSRLADSQVLSRALTQLQRLSSYRGGDCHQKGWAAVTQGRHQGLRDPDDLVAYTWRVLLDPGFATNWACKLAIVSAQDNPGSFDVTAARAEQNDAHQERRI